MVEIKRDGCEEGKRKILLYAGLLDWSDDNG